MVVVGGGVVSSEPVDGTTAVVGVGGVVASEPVDGTAAVVESSAEAGSVAAGASTAVVISATGGSGLSDCGVDEGSVPGASAVVRAGGSFRLTLHAGSTAETSISAARMAAVRIRFLFFMSFIPFGGVYSVLSAMSAKRKSITRASSAAVVSTCIPIFPPLKKMRSWSFALESITVGKNFFIPTGEQPP